MECFFRKHFIEGTPAFGSVREAVKKIDGGRTLLDSGLSLFFRAWRRLCAALFAGGYGKNKTANDKKVQDHHNHQGDGVGDEGVKAKPDAQLQ